jgi:TolB-like protein/DNA-binding winged helix-turn-helix (wHTH) protein
MGAEPVRTVRPGFRLGPWRVDPARNELRKDGETIRLEPKAIEVLAYLAARAGDVVPREELLAAVWPGVIVGDDALTQAIIKLRKALGDDAHKPTYIETISKRGYRLVAPVSGAERRDADSKAVFPSDASQDADAGQLLREGLRAAPSIKRTRRALGLAAGLAGLTLLAWIAAVAVYHGAGRGPWPLAPDVRGAASSLPVVAVLPLANLSGDPARDYFSDGVTEDIIGGLGRFSGLRVMSFNAVQEFKGRAAPLPDLRSRLGARYIVKGSIRAADGAMRVSVELSDAEKGVLLWSERFDGQGAQLFEIQDRIVRSIVGALQVRLTQLEQQRVFTRPTDELEAHDLVLRARSLVSQLDRKANREARALLTRARELAPDYAEVLTALGEAEMHRALYGWVEDPRQSMQLAEELARRALASPDVRAHARAHTLLSGIYSNTGQFEAAERHADFALAANPSDATALYRKASELLFTRGKVEESIAAHDAARRIDPRVGGNANNIGYAYFCGARYAESLALVDTMLLQYPRDVTNSAIRAATLAQMGRDEEARAAADRIRRLSPAFEVRNFGARFGETACGTKLREGLIKAGLQ